MSPKSFRHLLIGSPVLNRLGLHSAGVHEGGFDHAKGAASTASSLLDAPCRCRTAPSGTVRHALYAGLRPRSFGLRP